MIVRFILLIIMICFFFPFVTVSCQKQEITKVTGIQMVTGTKVDDTFTGKVQPIKPTFYAVAAFVCAGLGLIFTLAKNKAGHILTMIVSGTGFIFSLLLKFKIDNDITKQGHGVIQADYNIAYYLVLILFIVAAVISKVNARNNTYDS